MGPVQTLRKKSQWDRSQTQIGTSHYDVAPDVLKDENELLLFEYDYKDESINKKENKKIQKDVLVGFTNENLSSDEIEEDLCFDHVKGDISEATNEDELVVSNKIK